MADEERGRPIDDPISVTDVDVEPAGDADAGSRVLPSTVRMTSGNATIPGPPPAEGRSHGALPRRGVMRSNATKTLMGIEPIEESPEPPPTSPASSPAGMSAFNAPRSPQPTLPVAPPPPPPPPIPPAPLTEPSRQAFRDVAPVSLADALGSRVKLGGGGVPLLALGAGACLLTALLTLGVAKLAFGPAAPDAAPASADETSGVEAPEPSPAAADRAEALSVDERAAAGDVEALAAIANKPVEQRSVEESLAFSRGTLAQKRVELEELGQRLKDNPDLLRDRKWQTLIRQRAYELDTFRETLEMLAELPGPEGADMLYLLWTGTAARTDATRLAEELVSTQEVMSRASPSLSVALELRRAKECDAAKALLPKAIEHGDMRSVGQLGLLKATKGCGKNKQEDCYPCLREGSELDDAINAARRRAPPRY